jgi:predicted metal-dependent enzyme (double-stranded beta helix superfamily)
MSVSTKPASELQPLSGLQALVGAIRCSVRQDLPAATTAELVAANVRVALGQPDLLPEAYRQADREQYTQHVIHCEPDGSFSLVALVWLPGQCTPVHDHVSWCVPGVYEGEEHEQRYALGGEGADTYLVPTDA